MQAIALRIVPQRFCLSEGHVRLGPVHTRPYVNADDLLSGIFGALKAFVAQFHAGLVFATRAIGAVTFNTSGVLGQFALYFNMAMDGRHRNLLVHSGTHNARGQEWIS
jgi:hypothetical protein